MFAYSWDVATDVIERSGEAAKVLGIDGTQLATGASVASMVRPEDKESLEIALAKLTVDQPFLQVSYRIIRADGEVTWLQQNSRAYFNDNGQLQRVVGMIADITERKLAEEALSTVSKRLIQAQEQERTRIARELHDNINQRLALLHVEMNQMREELPSSREDLREHLEGIRIGLSDTSNEIESISHRLHSSKLEYLGLVTACRSFCTEVADRQKIRIEFKTENVPSIVPQDVSLALFRVLQESLQNAIKYSRAEHYEVELHGTSTEVRLTVRDDGIGFDVSAAITNRGLGLISMRERIGLVGGTIFIRSEQMHGTEIKVLVPVAVATDTTNLDINGSVTKKESTRPQIVLAEDNPEIRDIITRLVRVHFDVVRWVADGEQALNSVLQLKPGILVTDISMPILNGIEVASRLRNLGICTKVIFVTVHDDKDCREAAFSMGADGYVLKSRIYTDLVLQYWTAWQLAEPRLAFNKTVVTRYRISLEHRHCAPSTINLRLAAVRRLAYLGPLWSGSTMVLYSVSGANWLLNQRKHQVKLVILSELRCLDKDYSSKTGISPGVPDRPELMDSWILADISGVIRPG